MTKKHFVALADTMKDFFATNAGAEMDVNTRGVLMEHLVRFCEKQHPYFDKERFLDYMAGKCGPSGGKR